MRGITDAIDDRPRPGSAGHRADFGDRVDFGDNVGAMREGDQFDAAIGKQRFQTGGVEMPGQRVNPPFAQLDAVIRQPAPDAGIRFVVLIGHHNRCIPPAQPLPHGLRQNIGVGAGRRAERQLIRRNPHQRRKPRARLVHFRPTRLRAGIGAIGLHFAISVKAVQAVDDLTAGKGAARVFEKGVR